MALLPKKLFEVRMEVTAYVEAEDEASAWQIGEEALVEEARHLFDPVMDVIEVTHSDWPLNGGWDARSLIYGADSDMALGLRLQALPKKELE